MPLASGDRLGNYEILAPLGKGGMGEVYRAKDTKLDREVAIKIVPESFAHDPERIARFEREARVLAALNHPNIAQIYGLEERALIMELVEGPTLAERIAHGALPTDEALGIAKQIAEALEAAHEKGITHRDLKPANVKITPAGTVKVLDFGLATAAQPSTADGNPSDSPTLTLDFAATRVGMILGTAAYMSPEQAVGKPVDRRGDIWSFGVVLFEMLTGRRLFEGETISHVLADVIKGEIDLSKLPPSTPNAIRDLLKRCLDRDLKNRLQWIGEARIAIDHSGEEPQATAATAFVPQRRILPWAVAAVFAAAFILAAMVAWRATRPVGQSLRPLVRLDVDLGPDVSLGSQAGADAILSPDGTRLVYVSQNRLFTRRLDQPKAIELAGTEGAAAPFFSPDGQWVAFFAAGSLKKVPVEGGAALTICNASAAQGGSWGEDGSIVAALTGFSGLWRVASSGGTPAPLTELGQGEVTHRWPQVLPGSKAVLFTANRVAATFDGADVNVMSLADRRTKTLVRGGTFGRFLPSGHLVYINNGTLFAVPFYLDRLEVRGTPTPLLEQIAYSSANGFAQFEFSRNGTLVYRQGIGGGGMVTLQWLEGGHNTQSLLAKPGYYMRPHVSPDGQRLAMDIAEGSDSDVWVYDWQRDTTTRLTFGGGKGFVQPVWSPDGRYIVGKTNEGMAWIRADGASKPQSLTKTKNPQFPWSFSPDGKRLAYGETTAANGYEVWTLPVESNGFGLRAGKPEPFVQSPFDERQPAFSPDGRWLSYTSNESGVYQVYVRAFPDKGGKWQISNAGGTWLEWSRNGRELFFRTLDNRIMVASYTVKGDSFAADKPRVWSEKQLADFGPAVPNYDLAPDGKRIAALMPVEAPDAQKAQNHVIFLENFFDELRRRVPAPK
jgi:Tol biopolymer transport system component/predicted Ser/Thr protein kinase